ncbi:MAG: DNA/RNA nuclease SfsA [Hydrococcus sp. RM1_1_31]|nr:DNA/RNA nuclease SfsA [Hydrococcus sp. RM1_1_31]
MNSNFIYPYPPLISGILIKRYKRFLADIELASGEVITAHCPNTGPMIGVSTPGSAVLVSRSDNPNRKLTYTWEAIQVNDTVPTWVGINTGLPNRIIKLALQQKLLPELASHYSQICAEVAYGIDKKSRIDFLLTGDEFTLPMYVEVKNTTLAQGNLALFPDTVTTRGQKHLRELMALIPLAKPVMLYFINRSDCSIFAPGDKFDPTYGLLLREAFAKGVKILPYRFEVSPQGIHFLGLAELFL